MKIWHYNWETGLLVGEGEARPNPREPGKFLVPANATVLEPPKPRADHAVMWGGEGWLVVEDHRGEFVYLKSDGSARYWIALGPLPEEVTTLAPAQARPQVWDERLGAWVDDDGAIKALRIQALRAELVVLDDASIRGIREFVLSKNGGAPQELRDLEALAEQKRQELRDLEGS